MNEDVLAMASILAPCNVLTGLREQKGHSVAENVKVRSRARENAGKGDFNIASERLRKKTASKEIFDRKRMPNGEESLQCVYFIFLKKKAMAAWVFLLVPIEAQCIL